jgi:plastocyanin
MINGARKRVFFLLSMVLGLHLAGCVGQNSDAQDLGKGTAHARTKAGFPESARQAMPVRTKALSRKAQVITIDNFTYNPRRLTIPAGTKVTWINKDDVPHTVTSTVKPRKFQSPTLDTDDRFSHVFTAPGTYKYFCAVHPRMTAQIIVK